LKLGQEYGIPIEAVAHRMIEATYSTMTSEPIESVTCGSDLRLHLDEMVSEKDKMVIRTLEWLTYDTTWHHAFFYWACAFVRVFLLQRKVRVVDMIQHLAPEFFTSDVVGDLQDPYVLEFGDYQAMLASVNQYYRWAELHYRQKPHFIPSGLER
jgi:hypothetical protein